jgi:FemAB-related protein (PEP-CTERM system-associated)
VKLIQETTVFQEQTQFEIREYTAPDERDWDAFVLAHRHGSPFHLIAWKKTIEESYTYKPFYLLARDASGIRGVLPLFLVSNFAVGKVLISTPFGVYGGILANDSEARVQIHNAVKELGKRLAVDYIELRNAFPEQCVGENNVTRYVTFTQAVRAGSDEELLQSIPKKTRNLVRKAVKTPFTMRSGIRETGRFFDILSRNMRRLGTPCFPQRYFDRLLANFGMMVDIREVWFDDRLMAASVNFFYQGQMHTYHAAADTRFNSLGPNTFMYFDHLRWAGNNGYTIFDFGRSKKNTGVFEFKRHWDTTLRELPYEMILVRRKTLPNFSPANPKFQLAIRMWQRVPLFITRLAGPRLVRLFP